MAAATARARLTRPRRSRSRRASARSSSSRESSGRPLVVSQMLNWCLGVTVSSVSSSSASPNARRDSKRVCQLQPARGALPPTLEIELHTVRRRPRTGIMPARGKRVVRVALGASPGSQRGVRGTTAFERFREPPACVESSFANGPRRAMRNARPESWSLHHGPHSNKDEFPGEQ